MLCCNLNAIWQLLQCAATTTRRKHTWCLNEVFWLLYYRDLFASCVCLLNLHQRHDHGTAFEHPPA